MTKRDPFLGIRAKVHRAVKHLQFLHEEVGAFLDLNPYRPSVQYDRQSGAVVVRMHVDRECPIEWSIVAGEVLHNLRSALDNCVHELVILHTGHPPPTHSRSRTQFPIFVDEEEFARNRHMLAGVSTEAAGLIRTQQPFATGEREASPLWALKKLSDFDKHRTIHLTGAMLNSFKITFPHADHPGHVEYSTNKTVGPFEDGTELLRGRFVPDGPAPMYERQVQVQASLGLDVAFDKRTPAVPTYTFGPALVAMADATVVVLEQIGEHCFDVDPAFDIPRGSTS